MAALLWSAGAASKSAAPSDERPAVNAPATAPAAAATIQDYYAQGRALYQQGRFDEARAAFAEALRLHRAASPAAAPSPPVSGDQHAPAAAPPAASSDAPSPAADPSTRVAASGYEALAQGRPERGMSESRDDRVKTLYAAGRALYQQGRFDEARAAFAAAVQAQQGAGTPPAMAPVTVHVDIEAPLPGHLQTSAWLKQTRRQRARTLRQANAADKRLDALRQQIRRLRERAQHREGNKQHGKTLARLAAAEQTFVERQAEHARLAREIETLTGREAALWYNWGVEADLARDTGHAISRYRQALALHPRHTGALYNLATAHLKRRQVRQAEQAYRDLLAVDPRDADAQYNLGLIAEEYRHAPREALEYYRAYLASAPADAPERGLVQGWINVIEGSRKEVEAE